MREALADALESRFAEVEAAVLTKVHAISIDPDDVAPEYAVGLRAAVPEGIRFAIAALRSDDATLPPPPQRLGLQARLAARHHVGIENVMRRYIAGCWELGGFLLEALEQFPRLGRSELAGLPAPLPAALDRLMEFVGEEFRAARTEAVPRSQRRLDHVSRLLAGESVSMRDLHYPFDYHHLGLVSEGIDSPRAIQALAGALDGQLLLVKASPEVCWAWIARRSTPGHELMQEALRHTWCEDIPLGVGLASKGVAGWRRTHKEARVAFAYAVQGHCSPTSYSDIALAHSIQSDPLYCSALHTLYIAPLSAARDRGEHLRDTLRAYFASNRNAASAAAALGVARQTVASRLRAAEELLDCSLIEKATEVELALKLEDLAQPL